MTQGTTIVPPSSRFAIRQADQADWPAVAALLQAHQLPLDGARDHQHAFVVAHVCGEVVGVAGVEVHGDVALLRSVAVAPGMQGTGIGQALVQTLLDQAKHSPVRQVFLLTTTATAYFQRFGFAPVDRGVVPEALQASAEFQGACPASAALLGLTMVDALARAGTLAQAGFND